MNYETVFTWIALFQTTARMAGEARVHGDFERESEMLPEAGISNQGMPLESARTLCPVRQRI